MAIQFPPNELSPNEPVNGEEYLYLETQEVFVCRRSNQQEAAQWAAQGAVQDSIIGYRGPLFIQQPAPAADQGDIFSVADGGIADASFGSLAGQNIEIWSLVIYTGNDWLLVNTGEAGPWIRTINGRILPAVSTDDLDMDEGNYLINELPLIDNSGAPNPPDPGNVEVEGLNGLFNGPPFGEDENVQNVCNACDGNPDTFASASIDDTDRIHIMYEDSASIIEIQNTFEVKTQPNHYVLLVLIQEGQRGEEEMQADQNGIATFTNISGSLNMVRVSTDSDQFETLPQEETRVYYLKSDNNYLVDPDC